MSGTDDRKVGICVNNLTICARNHTESNGECNAPCLNPMVFEELLSEMQNLLSSTTTATHHASNARLSVERVSVLRPNTRPAATHTIAFASSSSVIRSNERPKSVSLQRPLRMLRGPCSADETKDRGCMCSGSRRRIARRSGVSRC